MVGFFPLVEKTGNIRKKLEEMEISGKNYTYSITSQNDTIVAM